MSLPKQILLAATLLLSAVSRTAAAPVTSLDLLPRSTDEAGHFLQTRGEDVYRRFREAGEEGSIGEIPRPKFPMKSKTTITKAKPPRKATGTRKHKESTIRKGKTSGKLGTKKKHAIARKATARKATGSRKSASEGYATKVDSKKTKSRSGPRHGRGPARKGNTGDRNQGSSQKSMRNMKRSNSRPVSPQPVSPLSKFAPSGHSSRVSALSTNSKPRPNLNKSLPPTPPGSRPSSPSPAPGNRPSSPSPAPGNKVQRILQKVKSFIRPKRG